MAKLHMGGLLSCLHIWQDSLDERSANRNGLFLQRTAQQRQTRKNNHVLNGIQTHDSNVRVIKAYAPHSPSTWQFSSFRRALLRYSLLRPCGTWPRGLNTHDPARGTPSPHTDNAVVNATRVSLYPTHSNALSGVRFSLLPFFIPYSLLTVNHIILCRTLAFSRITDLDHRNLSTLSIELHSFMP